MFEVLMKDLNAVEIVKGGAGEFVRERMVPGAAEGHGGDGGFEGHFG